MSILQEGSQHIYAQHQGESNPALCASDLYGDEYADPVYRAKAHILGHSIQEIGMGKYQWWLFVVAGFGWFADSAWLSLSGLILTPVVNEFHFNPPFLFLAVTIGLFVGGFFWGLGCDIWGRKWPFSLTLLIAGIFGLAAGGSPNFLSLAVLISLVNVGIGGNITVDTAVFLEFLPGSHQYLLTVLTVWWCMGQLVTSLVAWPLISNHTCVSPTDCTRSTNMGWRYLLFVLGGLTLCFWSLRFFIFSLPESPRFLSGIGRDDEAVAVIHRIAEYNGTTTPLTLAKLVAPATIDGLGPSSNDERKTGLRLRHSPDFAIRHVKALFATPKVAWSTGLLIAVWGIIGLASTLYTSFLPYILATRGVTFGDGSLYIAYRNQVILSVGGIPAVLFAGWLVERPYIRRKGTFALSSALTGALLLASTTSRTSNTLLGWSFGYVMFNHVVYGVLYAMSSEIFPAIHRGTGNSLASTARGVFAIMAPVIALYANLATAVPAYAAGGLFALAGALVLLLPYEPQGHVSI